MSNHRVSSHNSSPVSYSRQELQDLRLFVKNRDIPSFSEQEGKLRINAEFVPQMRSNGKLYNIDMETPLHIDYTDVLLSMDAETISSIVTGNSGEKLPSHETSKYIEHLASKGWRNFEQSLCEAIKQKEPAAFKHAVINKNPFDLNIHHSHIYDFFAYNGVHDIYNLTKSDMNELREEYGLGEKVYLPNGRAVHPDSNEYISGIVTVPVTDIIDGNFESFLDIVSDELTGTSWLSDITYKIIGSDDNNQVHVFVEGDVEFIMKNVLDNSQNDIGTPIP